VSTPLSVYKLRLQVDSRRQTEFAADLKGLDTELSAVATGSAPVDPYTLDRDSKKRLADRCEKYAIGGAGVIVVTADDLFQYRLASFPSLFRDPNTPVDSVLDIPVDELHDRLISEYRDTQEWMPLGRLLDGDYCGWRAITWWSPCVPKLDSVFSHAYTTGIPRDYVAQQSVILRFRTDDMRTRGTLRVPTCLDAFDAPVFCAARDKTTSSGRAVDLTDPHRLSAREREYVAIEIDSDAIQFVPVVREPRSDDDHRLESLWPHLEAFYATCLGGPV